MGKINLLSIEVANLIAAGEVVDRPASAVKELLENAIDSGADKITLEIQHGGVTFIRVADNGCGIAREDLIPAITRHSTSKISKASDLDSIFTLGFRGEALAAIASVSHLRIYSKLQGNEMGCLLETYGGASPSITETGCQEGTTVIVEDLFYNVPARRKFLKKDSTEGSGVSAVIEKIALSHPEISFRFIYDGEMKFLTPGTGLLRDTIWTLFGKNLASRIIEVSREENGVSISGYISESDFVRNNRNMENFFINGRYIKSKTAQAALEQAYQSKIPADKFPFCVLNISIDPSLVDVNVHPAKLEVKFSNEKIIFDAVYYSVLTALQSDVKRPELRLPHERDEAESHQKASADVYRNAFVPMEGRNKSQQTEQVRLNDILNALDSGEMHPEHKSSSYSGGNTYKKSDGYTQPKKDFWVSIPNHEAHTGPSPVQESHGNESFSSHEKEEKPSAYSQTKSERFDPYAIYDKPILSSEIPDYLILGEAWNTYVIVQLEDRLVFFDKHAAHERIIFDELCRKMRATLRGYELESQLLMVPMEIIATEGEAEALENYSEKITALGFAFETGKTGPATYLISVSSIPTMLDQDESRELFEGLITSLSDATSTVEAAAVGFFESRLWQASCKAAIKGGRSYDRNIIKWICDRLLKKPDGSGQVIRTCPHGRPVAFEIKKTSMDRQFDRLG